MTRRGLPLGEDVTLRRRVRGGVDGDGNDIWTNEDVVLRGCAVWPRSTVEIEGSRDTVITGLNLFTPPDTDISPTDRFLVRGAEYQVKGQPGLWRSPLTGREAGIEAALERVTG